MKRKHPKRNRTIKPRILILCEGQTEEKYFLGLKQHDDYRRALQAVSIVILAAKGGSPNAILEKAKKLRSQASKQNNAFDQIWLVFDHDNQDEKILTSVLQKAQRERFFITFSNLAFEVWLLLHFRCAQLKYLDNSALVKQLTAVYPAFKKGNRQDFKNLLSRLPTALNHAQTIRSRNQELLDTTSVSSIVHLNPYTDVDLLVHYLTTMSNDSSVPPSPYFS